MDSTSSFISVKLCTGGGVEAMVGELCADVYKTGDAGSGKQREEGDDEKWRVGMLENAALEAPRLTIVRSEASRSTRSEPKHEEGFAETAIGKRFPVRIRGGDVSSRNHVT